MNMMLRGVDFLKTTWLYRNYRDSFVLEENINFFSTHININWKRAIIVCQGSYFQYFLMCIEKSSCKYEMNPNCYKLYVLEI